MPCFWFDVSKNGSVVPDSDGLHFASLEAAGREALRSLIDMARDERSVTDGRELVVTVRDENGPAYLVTLVLRCEPIRS